MHLRQILFLICIFIELGIGEYQTSGVFHNQFAVHIPGGHGAADAVASRHEFVNLGQIGSLENYFLFEHPRITKRSTSPSQKHHKHLKDDPDVGWFQQQVELKRSKRDLSQEIEITDPLFNMQWFLNGGAVDGSDMNVKPAWQQGYTGKGVVVTILDDGIQTNHPDLAQNYDPDASTDINSNDNDPMPRDNNDNKHGTRCAGEVAAVAFNEYCGVGVAYNASIGGVRMLDGMVNDAVEAKALSLNPDHIDIYSASWGPEDDGRTVDGPGPLAKQAFINGVMNGRKKLGSIFVWASGNGGRKVDNCNCDGYTNSVYTLSISSATQGGRKPWYLEECSSTLATTYSSGTPSHDASITTVDQDGSLRPDKLCTSAHTGTSASAPIAAGICALALQANPKLTWRDMQHLVVLSSNPTPLLHEDGWSKNGVGKKFSHKFGYGLMDAGSMVNLAVQWPGIGDQLTCLSAKRSPRIQLRGTGEGAVMDSLFVDGCVGTDNAISFLEHVQCHVTVRSYPRGSLNIDLISPAGTRSSLLMTRPKDTTEAGFEDWPFLSVHFWGEKAVGNWTLEVSNKDIGLRTNLEPGTLVSWQIKFYGTESHPLFGEETASEPDTGPSLDLNGDEEDQDFAGNEGLLWVPPSDYPAQSAGECHPECQDGCQGGSGSNQCIRCKNFNFDSHCLSKCPEGTYPTVNHTCYRCHRDCKTCYGQGADECLSCKRRKDKQPMVIGNPDHHCIPKCPKGFFEHNSTECRECPAHCSTCSSDGTSCLTCDTNFLLLEVTNRCVPGCPAGMFADMMTKTCSKCHPDCATCVGPRSGQCGRCRDNFFYYERSCVKACPSGFFADLVTQECSPCPRGCKKCASENECIECIEGWQSRMVQSPNSESSARLICIQAPQGTDCKPFGEYFNSISKKCEVCHSSCNICFEGNDHSCLTCHKDHFLHINSCIDQFCPNTTYLSDATECRHCPHACATCSSQKLCKECFKGYVLSVSGQCLTSCPEGQWVNGQGHCQPCESQCRACDGSGLCTKCTGTKVYFNGSCLETCADGWYQKEDFCQRCHPLCQTCSGPGHLDCLSCHSGRSYSNGTCYTCPEGLYYDIYASEKCQKCHSDCKTCFGPSIRDCDTCKSPFALYPLNGSCTSCCGQQTSEKCCECDKLHNTCVVRKDNASKDMDEERSTRKRSSWGNTELKYTSSSSTLLIIGGVCIVCLGLGFFLKKFKRLESKRRYRRRKRELRLPNAGKTYERLPMTENGNVNSDDLTFSSSEDDSYPTNNLVFEERRRLVASLESGINSVEA